MHITRAVLSTSKADISSLLFQEFALIFFSVFIILFLIKKSSKQNIFLGFFADGWTTNDLVYMWKTGGSPVQLTANLSLPGGFKLDNHTSLKCDVVTATGNIFLQKILKSQWVLYTIKDLLYKSTLTKKTSM